MSLIEKQKIEAIAVKEMLETKGWEIVVNKMQEKANAKNSKLIQTDNEDESRNLKSDIRAINSLLSEIVAYSQINT